jgi:hypothetical protein
MYCFFVDVFIIIGNSFGALEPGGGPVTNSPLATGLACYVLFRIPARVTAK